MSRLYNRIDVVKIQPTLGQEKTKEFKKKLEIKNRNKSSKDMFRKTENKAKGGRVGLKFGSKKKSNIQKIQETFGSKKQLSSKQMKIAKLAGNPKKIDGPDFAKLRSKKA
mgnify:CR=1 FL=1